MSAAYLQALHADEAPLSNASHTVNGASAAAQSSGQAASSSSQQSSYGSPFSQALQQQPQQRKSSTNGDAMAPQAQANGSAGNVDVDSEDAFPSLASAPMVSGKGKGKQTVPSNLSWGQHIHQQQQTSGANGNYAPAEQQQSSRPKDTLVLPTSSIQLASPLSATRAGSGGGRRDEGPITSIGEASALIMRLNPQVQIDASTSKATTTFLLVGPTEASVAKAKNDLMSRISRRTSLTVDVPISVRAHVIGSKGRTLNHIIKQTGAQINLPPREDIAEEETDEDATIPVVITGHAQACEDARDMINAIVSERVARIVHHAQLQPNTDFEAVYWPFVKREHEESWKADGMNVEHSLQAGVKISGEKEKVQLWQKQIKETHDNLKQNTRATSIVIEKRQHRFLRGKAGQDILMQTGWSIELPSQESAEEHVTLRGPTKDKDGRSKAMSLVMEAAESHEVDAVSIADIHRNAPDTYIGNLCRYLSRRQVLQKSMTGETQVYLPQPKDISKGSSDVEIVAPSADELKTARQIVIQIVESIPPSHLVSIKIDPLLHKHVIPQANTKHSKAIKAILDKHNHACDLVFPSEQASTSDVVLLCWTRSGDESKIGEVAQEIQKIVAEIANIKSETFEIPEKYHDAIKGPSNTTLNAVVGEEKNVAIEFGPGDKVVVRGPPEEITRVRKDMLGIVERAETEGVETSYENEFDLDARFVGYIVGKNGSNINKLHQELGVNVQIQEAQQQQSNDKKKPPRARAHIVIRGRRENVEEARRRIVSHAERVADETTITVPLPSTVDRRNLVGKGGAYAQRLEQKYEVRINFPKSADVSDAPAEITVRGPRKGVEGARKELADLIEYEREMSHSVTVKIPLSTVSRVVGKQGANVNQISGETGASIDVDTSDSATSGTATVTIKGSKDAVATAKKQIQAVSKDSEDEVVVQVNVSRAMQPALIGKGGQNIRDMMTRAGGPTDVRAQGYMIRFPRQNEEPGDVVTLRGKKAIVEKLQQDILSQISQAANKTVLGVEVPKSQHASIIGRGGRTVNEISQKHNVKIIFPNWKDPSVTEECENVADLSNVAAEDLIRIIGSADACRAAAEDVKSRATSNPTTPRTPNSASTNGYSNGSTPKHVRTVEVPARYHRVVSDNGRFFRRHVPPRVTIDHGKSKPPSSKGANAARKPFASNARIDEEPSSSESPFVLDWEVIDLAGETSSETADEPIPWIISGYNEDLVEQTEKAVQNALSRARQCTHQAFLRIDRSKIPRVIGRGGSGLDSIRASAGVEVEVLGTNDADTLSFQGSLQGVEQAKAEVVKVLER